MDSKTETRTGIYLDSAMRIRLIIVLLLPCLLGFSQSWSELQKVVANDRGSNDNFAYSVSIYGDYALVGAPKDKDGVGNQDSLDMAGSVYVLKKDPTGGWSQSAKLVAPDREAGDFFGYAVAIDGPFAIIGAINEDENANGGDSLASAGSVYIFERDTNGNWTVIQKIVPSDRNTGDQFGCSVAIDGNFAVIGAQNQDYDATGSNLMPQAGAAYVFRRDSAGSWSQLKKLLAPDRFADDHFGNAVTISGGYTIIGAKDEKEDSLGNSSLLQAGSAYIFERIVNDNWIAMQKLTPPDRDAGDEFGTSVSVSGDYLIIGSPGDNEDKQGLNTMLNSGSAYIYERNFSGQWNLAKKICANDRDADDHFGYAVSIYGDYAAIGAHYASEDQYGGNYIIRSGAAYVFGRNPYDGWVQEDKIAASDRGEYDLFGQAVAINGNYVICGAYNEDEDLGGGNTALNAGSSYLYFGCGSRKYLNLQVCDSYLTPSGNHLLTQSGIYNDTIVNSLGCDSIITFNLNVIHIDTSVIDMGNALFATTPSAIYQWLDCDQGYQLIPGQVGPLFSPGISGNYAVEITINNCRDTSSCHQFIVINDADKGEAAKMKLYPNPSSGAVIVSFPHPKLSYHQLSIHDLVGRTVFEKDIQGLTEISLNLDLQAGPYFVRLSSNARADLISRLIIKHQ